MRGTTSEDEWEREVIRRQVEARAHDWQRMYHCRPRVKDDTAVTDEDIAAHDLVLYGGPDANALTKRIARKLPIRIERDRIRVGRQSFRGSDVGVKLCYPNPLSPERCVAVFAGLSADALDQALAVHLTEPSAKVSSEELGRLEAMIRQARKKGK